MSRNERARGARLLVALLLFALSPSGARAGEEEDAVRLVYAPRQGIEVFWSGGCAPGAALLVEAPAALFSAPAFDIAVREAGRIVGARCPDLKTLIVAGFDRLTGARLVGGTAARAQMWSFADRPEYAAGLARPGRDISGLVFGRETPRAHRQAGAGDLPAEDAALLAELSGLAAIPTGAPGARRVIVLASPADPGSRALYRLVAADHRGLAWDWILVAAEPGAGDDRLLKAVARGEPALLAAVFGEGRDDSPPLSAQERLMGRRILEYHFHTLASMKPELDHRAGRDWGFPTLVFVAEDGLKAVAGVPYDLDSLAAAVAAAPPAPELPAARAVFAAGYREEVLSEGLMAFAVREVALLAMPAQGARVLMRLEKGQGYPAALRVTTGGRRWYALAVFSPGTGYAYVPEEYMMLSARPGGR
ncbi:MAG: hypothetical protein KatS3mg119_0128 [Rhodothalassiaceae bacterium]|nr:MAG: hypothetical protein KatS3mg119_0128 [Rhodothalassiaceae bacterium]